MEKSRYHEMLPHEILARRKRFPAAFVGLGGLEWHGEHLAVGNDALKAEALCELAAQRSGGFAFPTLWYGEPRVTRLMEDAEHDTTGQVKSTMGFRDSKFTESHFGKTADEQIQFYQDLIYHVLIQMDSLEMKAVCLLCGHGPMYEWATPVAERFNLKFKSIQVFAGDVFHYVKKGADVASDHAAKWETSYLSYLRPDCVDMSVYLGRDDEPLLGIIGADPRQEASAEVGRKAVELIVEGMVRKAKQLIGRVGQTK